MREILFRGKNSKGEWEYGVPLISGAESKLAYMTQMHSYNVRIEPKTIGQFTGLTDKNGTKIFEGDIVQYQNLMEFDIQSVVKFGEYEQDGSDGEYGARKCIGFYVEVDNFTCPDWCDNQPEYFNEHWYYQNILEVAEKCEVIGNIHDNPEILE